MHVFAMNSSQTSGNTWYLSTTLKSVLRLSDTLRAQNVQVQCGIRDDVEGGQVDEDETTAKVEARDFDAGSVKCRVRFFDDDLGTRVAEEELLCISS